MRAAATAFGNFLSVPSSSSTVSTMSLSSWALVFRVGQPVVHVTSSWCYACNDGGLNTTTEKCFLLKRQCFRVEDLKSEAPAAHVFEDFSTLLLRKRSTRVHGLFYQDYVSTLSPRFSTPHLFTQGSLLCIPRFNG
ncbi:hypothetical protein A0H81_02802 [Grifola frondosa]|uniref:Uncharacterized protein n=1 Tax=Grifola frondosa TaxID=5627 RepID=A0A1C7MNN3_GRIFR|nr:hypothetical protein A0H81_02802 [Grifola frondosa]